MQNGLMGVGEVAKKMGITVRTLQYYDKEGLLSPSFQSEGGRRLYTDKDLVTLHRILSLKYIGFSLDDIKNRLVALDTPAQVADALKEQAEAVREKIKSLTQALDAIEALKGEVLQMQSVDFKKYADIIVNLQMKNEFYWAIKHFDDTTLDHIRSRFNMDSGLEMMERFNRLNVRTSDLYKAGVLPESEQGTALAKEWWDMVTEFTQGDMSLLPKLMEFAEKKDEQGNDWLLAQAFLEKAMEAYFGALGYNPLEGVNDD